MKRLCGILAVGLLVLGTATASADTLSISLSGTGVMTSPEGKVRVLLAVPNLPSFENRSISGASEMIGC